MVSFKRREAG